MATGGWSNRRAYPLLVSQMVDHALVKLQADKNLTRGKALNIALAEGLIIMGYLERAGICDPHVWVAHYTDDKKRYFQCDKCREVQVT